MISGYKKPLVNQDLWNLNKLDTSKILGPRFQHEWEKEVTKASQRSYVLANLVNCKAQIYVTDSVILNPNY